MGSWERVMTAAPELAVKVKDRFEAHGVALLATLRRDGAPRISGIETTFAAGQLWLGMMLGSLKAKDLLRDPRCALHSATVDKDVTAGDAKIAGVAEEVTDDDTFELYRGGTGGGTTMPRGTFHLFRVDVGEMSHLIPQGDHLAIESWSERSGYRAVARR